MCLLGFGIGNNVVCWREFSRKGVWSNWDITVYIIYMILYCSSMILNNDNVLVKSIGPTLLHRGMICPTQLSAKLVTALNVSECDVSCPG